MHEHVIHYLSRTMIGAEYRYNPFDPNVPFPSPTSILLLLAPSDPLMGAPNNFVVALISTLH